MLPKIKLAFTSKTNKKLIMAYVMLYYAVLCCVMCFVFKLRCIMLCYVFCVQITIKNNTTKIYIMNK